MLKNIKSLLYLVLLVAFQFSCTEETPAPDQDTVRENNMALGNPSGAGTSANNYLLEKPQYSLSYNSGRGIPNWVSWHLSKAWLGEAPRQDDFRADNTLPAGFTKVLNSDYTGSGFDRGHNCPSADRTGSETDNSATFLMTNMIPQAPNNNQRTWASLESYCRTLVDQGNELYIIMGNYGRGGDGSNGQKETIANGKITVPNRIWKVIVVLPVGTNDVSRITSNTRVIAVDTPNSNSINNDWDGYRTTVDAIETKTGYDLLSNVAVSVQNTLEAKVDTGPTQ